MILNQARSGCHCLVSIEYLLSLADDFDSSIIKIYIKNTFYFNTFRVGIYGDTSSNSPQLSSRMEDQPNSPSNVSSHFEEQALKKMELTRKAWDSAPIRSTSTSSGPYRDQRLLIITFTHMAL